MNTDAVGATPSLTVIHYLNGLSDQTREVLKGACNDAAQGVALAIENGKAAYPTDWEKSIEEIEKVVDHPLNQLSVMVKALKEQNWEELNKLDPKLYVESLKYPGYTPKLNACPKTVIVPGSVDQSVDQFVSLKLAGSFPYGRKAGYEPTLTINGKVYKVGDEGCKASTHHLEFAVKASDIISSTSYTVQVPWDNGGLFSSDRKVTEYSLAFNTLPSSPGKVEVVYRNISGHKEVEKFTSHVIRVNAPKSKKAEWTGPATIKPNQGYKFVAGSPKVTVLESHGVIKEPTITATENAITVTTTLASKKGSELGQVSFVVEAQEERIVPPGKRKEEVVIGFNETKTFTPKVGEKFARVKFDAYNEQERDFITEASTNPLLKVTAAENGSYVLEAAKIEV